ncbi:MAG: hypothetical protein AB9866_30215 [Syntrophobacteraceae bacterium]
MIIFTGCAMFLLFTSFGACAWAAGESSSVSLTIRQQVEQEALQEAVQAFEAGDYRRAKITFEILSETAQSAQIGREALFALASVKLILAQTEEEYIDAVATWKSWAGQIHSALESEDPRMITPFLLRLEPKAQAAQKSGKETQSRKSSKEPKDLVAKGILQNKQKEMESLRSRLELREREVRRLRHQLESLEEIHRKYQEKKQEATP